MTLHTYRRGLVYVCLKMRQSIRVGDILERRRRRGCPKDKGSRWTVLEMGSSEVGLLVPIVVPLAVPATTTVKDSGPSTVTVSVRLGGTITSIRSPNVPSLGTP